MTVPTFDEEQTLWQKGLQYIAGVDEVGRGAFAGPVVAAAVILPQSFNADGINDSKLLSPQQRETHAEHIKKTALSYAISTVSVSYINMYGIGQATQLAFRRALRQLLVQPDFILIDAFYISKIAKRKQKPIIKGDQKSVSIASASIIAKVYRDNLMRSVGKRLQRYEFAIHKGYGTKRHQALMKQYGLCKLHRTSFALGKFL